MSDKKQKPKVREKITNLIDKLLKAEGKGEVITFEKKINAFGPFLTEKDKEIIFFQDLSVKDIKARLLFELYININPNKYDKNKSGKNQKPKP